MPKQALPAALLKRAQKSAELANARHAAEARDLIATIIEKRRIVTDAFWDIGTTLARLKNDRLIQALGYPTFPALLERELSLSLTQANKLIAISLSFQRREALTLGQERAAAVVQLADARREPAAELMRAPVALPGHHERVRMVDLSVRAIQRAARVERRAHEPKGKRTAGEKAGTKLAMGLERALRGAGIGEAKVTEVVIRTKGKAAVNVLRVQFAAEEMARAGGVMARVGKLGRLLRAGTGRADGSQRSGFGPQCSRAIPPTEA